MKQNVETWQDESWQTDIRIHYTPRTDPKPWVSLSAPIGHENQGDIYITAQALEWVCSFLYDTDNIGRAMGVDVQFHVPKKHLDRILALTSHVLGAQWGHKVDVRIQQIEPKTDD